MIGLLAQSVYFVGHQIPLFLLIFGVLYLALGFAVKPLGATLVLPIAAIAIAVSLAWFATMGGGLSMMSMDVVEVIGVGIVLMVLGRIFAGV